MKSAVSLAGKCLEANCSDVYGEIGEMKLAIMQPYFLPYIGYYQLLSAVDVFIVYDNIKYTKKGWINRNRMLVNGKDVMFSLPLRKDSDSLDVVQRELAEDFGRERLLNQFKGAYRRAPYFTETFSLLERIVASEHSNLFQYIYNALLETCAYLRIDTEIRLSSGISIDHNLKAQDKVLALCEAVGADTYINPIGGAALYSREEFRGRGIELKFIKSREYEYAQFGATFVPWLSIIDVLMFNSLDGVCECIATNWDCV